MYCQGENSSCENSSVSSRFRNVRFLLFASLHSQAVCSRLSSVRSMENFDLCPLGDGRRQFKKEGANDES